MDVTPRKLKRAVILEEFVALTGDVTKAVILNQFIYWSERISDVDRFLAEERERAAKYSGEDTNVELQNGWIYKRAEDLAEETMLGLAKSNMRTHLKALIAAGWLAERRNPKYAWDRTMQYRVDFVRIRDDLRKIGHELEGYVFNDEPCSETESRSSETKLGSNETELRSERIASAIPEITTEITTEKRLNDDDDADVLDSLSAVLRTIPLNENASLYDYYFADIYAALARGYPGQLNPEVISAAGERYYGAAINIRTSLPKITVENPVGLFVDAYRGALAQWKAERYRAHKDAPIVRQSG